MYPRAAHSSSHAASWRSGEVVASVTRDSRMAINARDLGFVVVIV
ncbi:hypothetical protein L829_1110 [Mycobacteroides abscessus MAB_030201_1075]|uniref:Uncharacterized protein n=1 Tax=Mycobacteroides abscessus MAB_030201_1075 TaxID=1335410 RepID=A0A829PMA3_9MYCO|nr:hypothetical protein L829_1110 [Mycobacteroides abscessus MAB_030201_1075]ETZ95458.1 hypothetical protein L828_3194 [Mycobacteroides abscessus MAB_030201_1061]